MGDQSVRWLVKDKYGIITGPFSTTDVLTKIRTGLLIGEEQISLYPSGDWQSISYEESFFDALLQSLEDDMSLDSPQNRPTDNPAAKSEESPPPPDDNKTEVPSRNWGNPVVPEKLDGEKTEIHTVEERQKASVLQLHQKGRKGRAVEHSAESRNSVGAEAEQAKENKKNAKKEERQKLREKKFKKQQAEYEAYKKKKASQRTLRNVVAGILVILIGFFLYLDDEPKKILSGERVRLLRPVYKKGQKNRKVLGSLKKAIQYFQQDTTQSYRKSQQILVSRVESKNQPLSYIFLCMTYKELWEISYQDSKDFQTVQTVLRRAQKIDPQGNAASVCQVVNQWVQGNYVNALRIMEAKLLKDPGFVFFNQMVGDVYAARKDYSVAAYYFSKVREFWSPPPVWARTLIQEARMMRRLKKYGEAVKLYRALLNSYPRHAVGQIEKGILEFEVYQHIEKSRNHILSGLAEGQKIPEVIESEAFLNLARMSMIQGDKSNALKYGKKSFSIDSTNQDARKLVISLGGIKELNSISIDNTSMVYVGEQYMKMGNYPAAQSEFRAAFEANPKNSFAALRAGQALWKLNQGREAIAWVQKSVKADPRFLRSYVILADYLSARYDFQNAIASLDQARKINKRHHEVWRGYALVELRRRNFEGAVKFGERALKLYDTDIGAMLILSKAKKELGDYETAYQLIQQASELDPTDDDVQATYAKILVEIQGAYAGELYLDSLITQMPGKLVFRRTKGELLIEEERFEDAIDVFNEILAINPKDKETLVQMALVLQKKGEKENYETAREYLITAASMDPSDAEPLFLLGKLYLDSNQPKYAQAQFERVIQVNPKFPLSHYHAGLAFLKQGLVDEALAMADKESRINPGLPEPNLLAGEAYFKRAFSKQPEIASSSASQCAHEYREAIRKGYAVANAYIWLARCLRLMGALEEAESMLDQAEKLESGNPEIYKELGAIYEVRGDIDKTANWYNKYLRLSPKARDKAEILRRIQRMEDNQEEI